MAGDSFSLCRDVGRVFGPATDLLFFASPKKSKQKKGDPAVCVPQQSCGQPAVLAAGGVPLELATLKQSRALIHLQLRSSAHTEGAWGTALVALRATLQPNHEPCCNARRSRASSAVPNAVMRRRVAQGWADQGSRLFEAKPSSSETPTRPSNAAYRHAVPGDEFGSPFLCLLSFGEAKESESPAGARPGLLAPQKPLRITVDLFSRASARPGNCGEGYL